MHINGTGERDARFEGAGPPASVLGSPQRTKQTTAP